MHDVKRIILSNTCWAVILFNACDTTKVQVPDHFKTEVPFKLTQEGIIVNTYWGKKREQHELSMDNHSPSWVNNKILKGNNAIRKKKDFRYRTSTAGGTGIQGDIYICDSIRIGHLTFGNVALYHIPTDTAAKKYKHNGVIGENLIATGIWKIDFTKRVITFASSLDSLESIADAKKLPSEFSENIIRLNIGFSDGSQKTAEVDLGYSGQILLPLRDFQKISFDTIVRSESSIFATPSGIQRTINYLTLDKVILGKDTFYISVATNELVQESLIGLEFFSIFSYVILDYINHNIYLSPNLDQSPTRFFEW